MPAGAPGAVAMGQAIEVIEDRYYPDYLHSSFLSFLVAVTFVPLCPTFVPGMIFRGNPKKYLTEIQVLIEQDEG